MSSDLEGVGDRLGRELSDAVVLFHQAVAEQLGLNATDFKCLSLLGRMGPISAGQLAEATGLTSGAITGVIDRLERAGFVRRQQDPADRRRVIVQPMEARRLGERVGPIFDRLRQEMAEEFEGRYTPDQWQVIADYVQRTTVVLRRVAAAIR